MSRPCTLCERDPRERGSQLCTVCLDAIRRLRWAVERNQDEIDAQARKNQQAKAAVGYAG